MVDRFIADADLPAVAAAWARDYRVLAPVRQGAAIVYRVFSEDMHPFLGRPPTSSAKEALLPQTENLFTYTYRKDHTDLTRTEVFLAEPLPPEPTLILGPRPCDARGRHLLDRVFLERGVIDPQYTAHRASTLFVSVACTRLENTCFCHWTGGGLADESGSDVLLHPVTGGFVAHGVSPAGEKLLAALPEAPAVALAELAARRKDAPAAESAPDLAGTAEAFLALFEDMDFWNDQSARCLSCGVCTYLCPTCSCFNITDENQGLSGRRLRTWDTCMSALYTLEGSGHNPRFSRAHRLRNRVGHKFCYHPREFPALAPSPAASPSGLEFSCTGCGRCIKSCPVAVDIRQIVLDIIDAAAVAEKAEASQ
ncbi:MAG: 4Fe-4S dicluster domain-containing protein [Humidesulfovibrio sp.]|nr:4Fe-4S dicluster domain-containing protein [Humidesulfovibrio sp.]